MRRYIHHLFSDECIVHSEFLKLSLWKELPAVAAWAETLYRRCWFLSDRFHIVFNSVNTDVFSLVTLQFFLVWNKFCVCLCFLSDCTVISGTVCQRTAVIINITLLYKAMLACSTTLHSEELFAFMTHQTLEQSTKRNLFLNKLHYNSC